MWTSDSFDQQLSQSYTSYFLLENNRLTCAILDEGEAALKAIQEVQFDGLLQKEAQLSKAFSKLQFSKLDFYQSRISIQHGPASLLPLLNDSDNANAIVATELGSPQDYESIFQEKIEKAGLSLSAYVHDFLRDVIERNLPNANIHLCGKSIIEEMLRLSKFESSPQIQWILSPFLSSCALVQEGKLKLFNQFKAECTEDILYYTLNILEQEQIDAKETTCWITGQVKELGFDLALSKQYLPQSQFRNNIQGLDTGLVSDVAINRNFTLLNQFLCA